MKKSFLWTSVVLAFGAVACSSSSSSQFSGLSNVAISSPFVSTSTSSDYNYQATKAFAATYFERKEVLEDLVEANDKEDCKFDIDLTVGSSYASCYGPSVALISGTHPDGTYNAVGAAGNPLPQGDLGIWASSDSDGVACVAAQINQLVDSSTKYAYFSQQVAAALYCFANNEGLLPEGSGASATLTSDQLTDFGFTAGSSTLSASAATITVITDSAGNSGYKFEVDGSVSGGSTMPFTVIMQYADQSDGGYSGTVSYVTRLSSVSDQNCNPTTGSSPSGTMVFAQDTKSSDVKIKLEVGSYCGTTYDPLVKNSGTAIEPCDKFGSTYSSDSDPSGWGYNWNRLVFNYDPDSLIGKYSYAWMAGKGDGYTRVFNAEITDEDSGVGYFGFGPDIASVSGGNCNISSDIGEITSMICNWAGPSSTNPNRQPANYVQKQEMTKASGKWTMSSEKIRYVPTNSCDNGAPGNLVYCAGTTSSCPSVGSGKTNDSAEVLASATSGTRLSLETLSTYSGAWSGPSEPSF